MIVVIILCIILLFLLVSGGYVFVVACARRKDLPWLVEEEIIKTSYGKYYHYIVQSHQWLQEHNAEDVYVSSYDGLKLHGFWIPAKDAKGTVLFAHGYRSTMLVDFGLAFDFYHKQGMNLLIPEQRCHGKSEGRFITFGVKESKDMLSWLAFHNERFGVQPVLLSGLSMGASTMMYLADEALPANVKGIIADCGFTSPRDILSCVFTAVTHMPASPVMWATDMFARIFARFSLSEKDTRVSLTKNHLPILMVHGKADGFVPCRMTEEGYAACRGQKEILLVDGADHGVSFLVDHARYTDLVRNFLCDYVYDGKKKEESN